MLSVIYKASLWIFLCYHFSLAAAFASLSISPVIHFYIHKRLHYTLLLLSLVRSPNREKECHRTPTPTLQCIKVHCIFTNSALWAELVIESTCPSVYLMSPSNAIFFEASHWPSGHMIRCRPLVGPQVT